MLCLLLRRRPCSPPCRQAGSCARASVSESAPAAPGDDDQAHHPQGVPTVKTRRAQIRPAAAITWRRASQLAQAFPRGPQTLVITPFSVSSVMARVTRFRRCLAHGSRAAAALRRTRAVGGPLLFVGPKRARKGARVWVGRPSARARQHPRGWAVPEAGPRPAHAMPAALECDAGVAAAGRLALSPGRADHEPTFRTGRERAAARASLSFAAAAAPGSTQRHCTQHVCYWTCPQNASSKNKKTKT